MNRRDFLKRTAVSSAGITLTQAAGRFAFAQQDAPPKGTPAPNPPGVPSPNPASGDKFQQFRAMGATTKIQVTKLRDTIYLLQGVGGNMVVQTGPDGKVLIDSSAATAAPVIKDVLAKLSPRPLKLLINTHWHYDHTDGNAAMHDDYGAFIIAQENTRKRLLIPQEIKFFGVKIPASPTSALPQVTFHDGEKLFLNNDELDLGYMPDAHTDSDIYVHFINGNVLHTGDIFFNGFYPFVDAESGGTINGMIRAADTCLELADDKTKIVPGHGPLGDKDALQKYRDMLATVATRIEKLKSGGQSLQQAISAKPTADFDAAWGKGLLTPDLFVTVVYNTL